MLRGISSGEVGSASGTFGGGPGCLRRQRPYRVEVVRAPYRAILRRPPSPEELLDGVNYLAAGGSVQGLEAALLGLPVLLLPLGPVHGEAGRVRDLRDRCPRRLLLPGWRPSKK